MIPSRRSYQRRVGFEPATPWFVARYSIQLSYRRTIERRNFNDFNQNINIGFVLYFDIFL